MMTFLLSSNFNLTAFLLDRQRLQKQRVEVAMIINILCNPDNKSKAWVNHTIVRSWKYFIYNENGYDPNEDTFLPFSIKAIKYYMNCIIKEYLRRGIGINNYAIWPICCNKCDDLLNLKNEMQNYDNSFKILKCDQCNKKFKLYLPWWINWSPFIQSNIAMLIRKKPTHYKKISKMLKFKPIYLKKGYIWPCNVIDKRKILNSFSEIPDELIKPIYCNATLKSGKKTGQLCNNIVRKKCNEKCNVHKNKIH